MWASLQFFLRGFAFQRLGQAEVQHFNLAIGCELDVGGLQIAMNNPALMRILHGFSNLRRYGQGVLERKRSLPDAFTQRRPFDQFYHQRRRAVRFLQAVDSGNVGMVK